MDIVALKPNGKGRSRRNSVSFSSYLVCGLTSE